MMEPLIFYYLEKGGSFAVREIAGFWNGEAQTATCQPRNLEVCCPFNSQ